MQGTIIVRKDNGEVIELVKEVREFSSSHILETLEAQVTSIKEICLPLLSEKRIEQNQKLFEGKKNQKKERN